MFKVNNFLKDFLKTTKEKPFDRGSVFHSKCIIGLDLTEHEGCDCFSMSSLASILVDVKECIIAILDLIFSIINLNVHSK